MSANENYELAVRLRGEQIDETQGEIEDVEQQFGETADAVADSADEMEGFAGRFDGAMTAIMGAFAIASAGLLSQIPIVNELATGLAEVLSAVAFQMDEVLRPVLGPVVDGLFALSDAIFNADGALGSIIGVVASLALAFVTVALPLAKFLAMTGRFSSTAAVFRAAAGGMMTALGGIASALGISTLAAGALVVALLALVAAFATDFMGIRSGTVAALEATWQAIGSFSARVTGAMLGLAASAFGWGADLMAEFARGIMANLTAPINAAEEALAGVAQFMSFDQRANDRKAERWGRDIVANFATGMRKGERQDLPQSGLGSDDGGMSRPTAEGKDVRVFLDGKRVDKGTRRHRGDETAPRGRHS